jgi:ArsR family transcriptional regulator
MSTRTRPDGCCTIPIRPAPLADTDHDRLVMTFKALADPTRLDIFRLIAAQDAPICVCDVTERFDVSQPTISHHLKVLRDAGLVTASRRGVWAYYEADPQGLAFVRGSLEAVAPSRLVEVL